MMSAKVEWNGELARRTRAVHGTSCDDTSTRDTEDELGQIAYSADEWRVQLWLGDTVDVCQRRGVGGRQR